MTLLLDRPIPQEEWLKAAGERDGTSRAPARLRGVDGLGRGAHPHSVWRTPELINVVGREATSKVCGVDVAKPQGHSWTPPPSSGPW